MKACFGNTKHNFKPLSDVYIKYKGQVDTTPNGYNYSKNVEASPGVKYATLFCPGCGTVTEVIAENYTEKELHKNVGKKESRQNAKTNGAASPTAKEAEGGSDNQGTVGQPTSIA